MQSMSDLNVSFVGTGGTVPSARRGLPATLIKRGAHRILVDCGEGTQRSLTAQGELSQFEAIAITHAHADHLLGIPGLLKSWDLQGRIETLRIFGPNMALTKVSNIVNAVGAPKSFDIDWDVIDLKQPFRRLDDEYSLQAYRVDHGSIPAYGYVIGEEPRPGRFDPEKARRCGVTDPRDFGRLTNGQVVEVDILNAGRKMDRRYVYVHPKDVMGPTRPGRKIVLSGDAYWCHNTEREASGADLLVHDGSYMEDERARAKKTRHGVIEDVVQGASHTKVRNLALHHIQHRYSVREVISTANKILPVQDHRPNLHVPNDGDTLNIPYQES